MRLTFVCWELFLFRSEFVAQTLHACEIGFGRSERKEHIQAYGQVILIVGDEETYEFVVLAVLALNKREDETTELLLRVFHLKRLLALVFQPGV